MNLFLFYNVPLCDYTSKFMHSPAIDIVIVSKRFLVETFVVNFLYMVYDENLQEFLLGMLPGREFPCHSKICKSSTL